MSNQGVVSEVLGAALVSRVVTILRGIEMGEDLTGDGANIGCEKVSRVGVQDRKKRGRAEPVLSNRLMLLESNPEWNIRSVQQNDLVVIRVSAVQILGAHIEDPFLPVPTETRVRSGKYRT